MANNLSDIEYYNYLTFNDHYELLKDDCLDRWNFYYTDISTIPKTDTLLEVPLVFYENMEEHTESNLIIQEEEYNSLDSIHHITPKYIECTMDLFPDYNNLSDKFSLVDKSVFPESKYHRHSIKFLQDNCYIKNTSSYILKDEFSLSFYFKISREVLFNNAYNLSDNIIPGITWSGEGTNINQILLYDIKDSTDARCNDNRRISIKYGKYQGYIYYPYQAYNGTDFLFFLMNLDSDKVLRVFIDGNLYIKEQLTTNGIDLKFSDIKIGNYRSDDSFAKPNYQTVKNNLPIVEFDEFVITNKNIYTESFISKNVPLNELYPKTLKKVKDLIHNDIVDKTIYNRNYFSFLDNNLYNK